MTMQTTPETTAEERFVASLRKLGNADRAELRRCLSADRPSGHLPAYRIVERDAHVRSLKSKADRDCYYLVGALFSLVERGPDRQDPSQDQRDHRPGTTLARAVRLYDLGAEKGDGGVSSVEKRFLNLLDSDETQLPYRLRQMVQMIMRGQNAVNARLDWAQLLKDLLRWNRRGDTVRQAWAREFYATPEKTNEETSS